MSRDALVVGINQYQTLPSLSMAANDAEGIAALLEAHSDFRVRRLPEAIDGGQPLVSPHFPVTTQHLQECLVKLLMPKGEQIPEAVLFYFSGHGLQHELGVREGYLAASDSQAASPQGSLSLLWLRRLIRQSPVRQIVVILDCCHSGEFLAIRDEPWQARDGHSYLFIAASRGYEAAYESLNGCYSVLTQAVLTGLTPQPPARSQVTSTDLAAWIANQLSGEIQQPLYEQSGAEITITRPQGQAAPVAVQPLSQIARLRQYRFNFCPYRGPLPFDEKYADFFFGRDELTEQIVRIADYSRLCVIAGASGSGRTSLLRAGLWKRLRAAAQASGGPLPLLRYVDIGHRPIQALATAFIGAGATTDRARQQQYLQQILKDDADGISTLTTEMLQQQPHHGQLWLAVDGVEALLKPAAQSAAEAQRAIDLLMAALHNTSVPLRVVLGLRADARGDLTACRELHSLAANHLITIPPMSYQQLRDVIEKPAEKVGLQIEPHLIHNLMLDLTGAAGELSLLQGLLLKLWHKRRPAQPGGAPSLTLDSYVRLGRLSNLLVEKANACYRSLSSSEQLIAKRIFLSLCSLGDGRSDHGRRVSRQELSNPAFTDQQLEQTIGKLAQARLVTINQCSAVWDSPGQMLPEVAWPACDADGTDGKHRLFAQETAPAPYAEVIELAHGSLISDWELLRQWLSQDRRALRQQRDIEDRTRYWYEGGCPRCTEYLLSQQYLHSAHSFLDERYAQLSTLAQQYVGLSRQIVRRRRWQTWGTLGLPLTLGLSWLAAPALANLPQTALEQFSLGPAAAVPIQPLLGDSLGRQDVQQLKAVVQRQAWPTTERDRLPHSQLALLLQQGILQLGAGARSSEWTISLGPGGLPSELCSVLPPESC